MDIDQWLQNTSATEEKSLAARLGIPSFLQRANPEPASPRHKRKRHRPSRDSSLLEEVVPQQADAPTRQQEAVADPIDSDSHSEISNRSAGTSVSAATSAALYRRRPRRKTKADRYDPKSAKPRKRREKTSDDRKEAKGGKKVRRSREKHGVGLVHTYHTKNVAADRVTLKPQKNAGLFRNGRASSPRRGRGLPDLCFSEMKFLQKLRDPSKEPCQATKDRSSRKKKQEKAHEEQISNYFQAKKPPLSERNPNIQSSTTGPNKSGRKPTSVRANTGRSPATPLSSVSCRNAQEDSACANDILSSIELPPERAILGVGCRANEAFDTSHFAWSVSPSRRFSQAPSVIPPATRNGVSELSNGSSGDEAPHSEPSRPVSRGKKMPQIPPEPTMDQKTRPGPNISGKDSSYTRVCSRPSTSSSRTSSKSCKRPGKARDSLPASNITNEPIMHGALAESSSSLSRLLHECEAVLTNQPFEHAPTGSRGCNLREDSLVAHRVPTEERRVDGQKRSRPESRPLQPLLQTTYPQENGYRIYGDSKDKGHSRPAISFEEQRVYQLPSYENAADDSAEMQRNDGIHDSHADWGGDKDYHIAMAHNGGIAISDSMDDGGSTQIEEGNMFAGFWKPNKLY